MKIVFPLFSRLTGKKILFPRVHIQNISPPGRDLFWQAICKKPTFKMGDTNLKKNGSVLLYLNMSRLDSVILCLLRVLHLEIQIHHGDYISMNTP